MHNDYSVYNPYIDPMTRLRGKESPHGLDRGQLVSKVSHD